MSTQPVSNSIFQELQSFYQNRTTDLKQLGTALQAGDLTQAQQVYSALVALGQSGPFGNSEPFAIPGRADAFEALGQALQSGDLAGAQSAFAKLQQAPSGPPRHGGSLVPAYVVTIGSTDAQPVGPKQENYWHQRKDALDQLGTALQSGDAAAAQQAYDALVTLGQNGPLRNGATFHRADRAQDFAAIGQALQSGDLAGAQQAFATLEDTFKHHGAPPPPAPVVSTGPAPTPAPVVSTQPPPGTLLPGPPNLVHPPSSVGGGPSGPPNLIINLGGTPSTGNAGDIVINLATGADQQGANGSEEVAINFNRGNASYQLVLNLLETGSSGAAAGGSLSLQA